MATPPSGSAVRSPSERRLVRIFNRVRESVCRNPRALGSTRRRAPHARARVDAFDPRSIPNARARDVSDRVSGARRERRGVFLLRLSPHPSRSQLPLGGERKATAARPAGMAPPAVGAPEPPQDALTYVRAVKARFAASNPQVYEAFLDVMRDFKNARCVRAHPTDSTLAFRTLARDFTPHPQPPLTPARVITQIRHPRGRETGESAPRRTP